MKTIEYIFSINVPDSEVIESDRYQYNYYEEEKEKNENIDSSFYIHDNKEDMIETMEKDKIEWVFDVLSVTHRKL